MEPKRCPYPNPWELHVTLCGKRGFRDVITLRILRWGNYPGLPGWIQCNPKGPYKRDRRVRVGKDHVMMEAERLEDAMLLALKI